MKFEFEILCHKPHQVELILPPILADPLSLKNQLIFQLQRDEAQQKI